MAYAEYRTRAEITVPLEGGAVTIAASPLRGRARIEITLHGRKPIALYATESQLAALLDVMIARRDALRGRVLASTEQITSPLRVAPLGVLTAAEIRCAVAHLDGGTDEVERRDRTLIKRVIAKLRAAAPESG